MGYRIDRIDLKPVTWDHLDRWESGQFSGPLQLLAELCGRSDIELKFLTYPDVDRVMQEYMLHLPQTIRDAIAGGKIPTYRGPPPEPEGMERTPDLPHNDGDRVAPDAERMVHGGFGDAGPDMDI